MWHECACLCLCLYLIGLVRAEGFEMLGRGAPVQMDVGAAKHITICTGLKRFISCRDGSNIAITYAFWGRTSDKICPSDDGDPVTDCDSAEETESLVKKYCEGRDQCQLEARHQYLQKNGTHHCPGVNKYLLVNYTCIPESKGVVLCDSEESSLECRAGWKIVVNDAFWGRRASAKYCGTADNGMECSSQDYVLKYLKKSCDGVTSCKVRASSDVLEDKRSTSCPGLLKYLLVNYACRPMGGKGANDDENETTVENKLLADTSSKELMGLLEKHLNELQTPKPVKGKTEASKIESDSGKGTQSRKPPSSSPAKQTRHSIKSQGKVSDAQEASNLPSQYLSGNAFVRTLAKESASDKESPAMDIKETETSKKSQESVPAAATTSIKHDLPKASVESVDESYEVPEPTTVKSILARAKEVLKSLDDEDSSPSIRKSDITRKSVSENDQTEKAVKQVAKLAQNLVKTANKAKGMTKGQSSSKHNSNNTQNSNVQQQQQQQPAYQPATSQQVVQQRSEKKPEPGPKKTGKSATGLGSAGVGNTP